MTLCVSACGGGSGATTTDAGAGDGAEADASNAAETHGPDTADVGGTTDVLDASDGPAREIGDPRLDINQVWPGAGCGKPLPDDQPPTRVGAPAGYKHYVVMGTGATLTDTPDPARAVPRTFWVRVPADYDPNHPYRVVYIGQGCGAFQAANTNTLQLYKESLGGAEQAIYVAMDIPENGVNFDCYDNRGGLSSQEWEAFQMFQEVVDANYCADLNHIYVTGYSTGGWLSNMWGCYFAGWPAPPRKLGGKYHIRAQGAVTGGEPTEQPACGGPVAALWIHDRFDSANPYAGTLAALARVGRMNGCDTSPDKPELQVPWHPENPLLQVCKKFTGCPADYPVVLCTTEGLAKSDQHERVIPAFTLLFDEIEAPR